MAQARRASKGKRPNKAVSVLGIAGRVFGRVDHRIASGYAVGVFGRADCRIGGRYTLAEYGAVQDPYARRGGNLRREPGDVLSLRHRPG